MSISAVPNHLYKILSVNHWAASQGKKNLELDSADDAFIHFSMEHQLERILNKYWSDQDAIVLTVDSSKLKGKLVLEANPGGSQQYYHLYNGSIPLDSIVKVQEVFCAREIL